MASGIQDIKLHYSDFLSNFSTKPKVNYTRKHTMMLILKGQVSTIIMQVVVNALETEKNLALKFQLVILFLFPTVWH